MKRNPGGIKSLSAAVFVAARPPVAAPVVAGQPPAPATPTPARTPAELDGLMDRAAYDAYLKGL